jgi:hypothetical protein
VSRSIEITVTDPNTVFAANTLCVGASSTPVAGSGGCPAGAAVMQNADFDAVINGQIATKKRILFKRGDTFTSSTDADIDVNGPGLIGAFGSGAAPVVSVTGNNNAIQLSSGGTPTIKDWRIMDLEIDGNSGAATNAIYAEGRIDQVTLLRLNIHHVHVGVRLSPFILEAFGGPSAGHSLWDQIAIVDSTISTVIGGSGGNGLYVGAQRLGFMGNTVSDTTGAEHVSRWPYVYKAVMSHNNLSNPAPAKVVVKLQSWPFSTNVTNASELIVFSDNKVTTSTGWAVVLGPQDTAQPEIIRHVIVERNWFAPNPAQQVAVYSMGESHTIRNNLFNLSGTSQANGVTVGPFPGASHGTRANVHVYNNTFYSSTTGSFSPIAFTNGSGHTAKNNLGYAPLSTSRDMVSGSAINENNTSDAGILLSPGFVSLTPSAPADFALGAASSAINAGGVVPVFTDVLRRNRPMSGAVDRGAFERP